MKLRVQPCHFFSLALLVWVVIIMSTSVGLLGTGALGMGVGIVLSILYVRAFAK